MCTGASRRAVRPESYREQTDGRHRSSPAAHALLPVLEAGVATKCRERNTSDTVDHVRRQTRTGYPRPLATHPYVPQTGACTGLLPNASPPDVLSVEVIRDHHRHETEKCAEREAQEVSETQGPVTEDWRAPVSIRPLIQATRTTLPWPNSRVGHPPVLVRTYR